MIVLFTDFGNSDHYVGQLHAAILERADVPIIDLTHNVPNYNARAGAYLLDALQRQFRAGDVFVCVVDPGVGGARAPIMMLADDKWYVGPDNGLFEIVSRRACTTECFRIDWRPTALSESFHGRDLFAPVAADLVSGERPDCSPWELTGAGSWPDDLAEIIYIDHYGNALTGIRGESMSNTATLRVHDEVLRFRETFSSARGGEAFWYRNSAGLVEIAAREDSAARALRLKVGDEISVTDLKSLLG